MLFHLEILTLKEFCVTQLRAGKFDLSMPANIRIAYPGPPKKHRFSLIKTSKNRLFSPPHGLEAFK